MKLNKNELNVLKACVDNAMDAAGGDFGFTDEVVANGVDGLSKSQIKGYLSALQKKYIDIDSCRIDNGVVHQITFQKDSLEALIEANLINVDYAEEFEAWYH